MVFNQKRSIKRRSSRQSTPPNKNNRNSVDLMQLVRSRSRYHPYVFDSNFTPMTASRRSQNSLRNTRHDMNQFYRSVYGEISPHTAVSYNEGREDMATNTSYLNFPALAQPQELPTTSMATYSGNAEIAKDMDPNKIDKVNLDKNPTSSCPTEETQPSLSAPVSQTSSKSSSNEINTTDDSPSSVSFIEEGGSMGLHCKTNTDSAESSSDIEKTFLPSIFADLMPTQNSSEHSAGSASTIDVVPQDDIQEQNSQIAADEEAGGDGEHNNNSVIEIEITVTTANDTNSDEDEYEGGDEES